MSTRPTKPTKRHTADEQPLRTKLESFAQLASRTLETAARPSSTSITPQRKTLRDGIRPYQVLAAEDLIQALPKRSTILQLPPGMGKSLVSQFVLRHRLDVAGATARTLVITPTVELRRQYVRLGKWLQAPVPDHSPGRFITALDDTNAGRSADFLKTIRTQEVCVATPKFLDNRMAHFRSVLPRIDLCVLDEIDLWSVAAPEDGDDHVRVHEYMTRILPVLFDAGLPILGLTGSRVSNETQALLEEYGCADTYTPQSKDMTKYLPRSTLITVRCKDSDVAMASIRLTQDIGELEGKFLGMLGEEGVSGDELYKLVMRHCAGNGELPQLAARIRDLWMRRTLLHEDRGESGLLTNTAKQQALEWLIRRHDRVVIYARERALVEHLASTIKAKGRTIDFAHADARRHNISRFQRAELNALVMTRSLGLRGLDFPDAEAMVVYSAKHSPIAMDQELCRIRGQRRHKPPKSVYCLVYDDTYEVEKTARTLQRLFEIRSGKFARYETARSPIIRKQSP